MYSIILEEELFNYMMDSLEYEVKNRITNIENSSRAVNFRIDVDTKLDIMEYVEDKQLAIGFVNQDYLNSDGEKLQKIYDEIYYQTN